MIGRNRGPVESFILFTACKQHSSLQNEEVPCILGLES